MRNLITRLAAMAGVAVALAVSGSNTLAEGARPELRAFWADAFEPGIKSPQECDTLLKRLHDAHCNAVFAQVRKGGDAYYRSHYEPWAADNPQHFDALAYLVQHAHAMNPPIAVHAWINTTAVGGNGNNPFNIVHLHRDWLSLNPAGADFDGEATKIDPGSPGAADWTYRVYMDVARHYQVDGIHFDFVRYGGPEWGYNPVSVARFTAQHKKGKYRRLAGSELPDPTDRDYRQWRRDQVTALVRKVYAQCAAVNPKLVVSAAVITWGDGPHTDEEWYMQSAAMNRVYQDWRGWLQEGCIDLACPMTYFRAPDHTLWQQNWANYIKEHQYGRAATVGVGLWFNTIANSLQLIDIAREKSPAGRTPYGVMLYSYGGTGTADVPDAAGKYAERTYQPELYAALTGGGPSSPPFATDAPIPEMDWKTDPRGGVVKGFVLNPDLDPVDGATVQISGPNASLRRTTDGTGFFAAVDVPPGSYVVRVRDGRNGARGRATVKAGEASTVLLTSGHSAGSPRTQTLARLFGQAQPPADGTPVRLDEMLVTLGTDVFPGSMYVIDGSGHGILIHLDAAPETPFIAGDIVSVSGSYGAIGGERCLVHARGRLTDIANPMTFPGPLPRSGAQVLARPETAGSRVRIQGRVTSSSPTGFTVDDGTPLQVLLEGTKGSGVEAVGPVFAPPKVGAHVSVTGVSGVRKRMDGTLEAIVRPDGEESLEIVPEAAGAAGP